MIFRPHYDELRPGDFCSRDSLWACRPACLPKRPVNAKPPMPFAPALSRLARAFTSERLFPPCRAVAMAFDKQVFAPSVLSGLAPSCTSSPRGVTWRGQTRNRLSVAVFSRSCILPSMLRAHKGMPWDGFPKLVPQTCRGSLPRVAHRRGACGFRSRQRRHAAIFFCGDHARCQTARQAASK